MPISGFKTVKRVSGHGGGEVQTLGIRVYFEDRNRAPNAALGPEERF
jgi:hypothetical protein